MVKTRSEGGGGAGGSVEPFTDKVQASVGLARGKRQLKDESTDRGRTRAGTLFTRESRGNYSSMADLRRAHRKIFSLEPTFCLLGEWQTSPEAIQQRFETTFFSERPISGREGGLAEAVLRVSSWAHQDAVKKSLSKAGIILFETFPDSTIYCQVTANAVLSDSKNSFSLYFGQRFSPNSRHVNYGQKYDESVEKSNKSGVFELNDPSDVSRLPTKFSPEHFSEIFGRNFGESSVRVTGIVNLIYKFSKGLDSFADQKATAGRKWIDLF